MMRVLFGGCTEVQPYKLLVINRVVSSMVMLQETLDNK